MKPAQSPEGREQIVKYKLGSHGLLGFTPDGTQKVMIKGHDFDKVQILDKVEELLYGADAPKKD